MHIKFQFSKIRYGYNLENTDRYNLENSDREIILSSKYHSNDRFQLSQYE